MDPRQPPQPPPHQQHQHQHQHQHQPQPQPQPQHPHHHHHHQHHQPPPHQQHQHQPQHQPQLPFTRGNNVTSPPPPPPPGSSSSFARSPFPPASNPGPPYPQPQPQPQPPSHHPPTSASPAAPYVDHQRRASDTAPPYYSQQSRPPPPYAPEPTSHPSHGHARHLSSSSAGPLLNRNMPPPPSPPQQHPQPHQVGHFGAPPAPRAPPMNIGPPNTFPSSRELPPLNAGRSGSAGGGMSISAMLGNSAAASGPREPTPGAHHPSFIPPPATSAAASGPTYAGSVHASPRMPASSAEYHPYPRRPQTPDQGRPYDARDHRGNAAGSPPQPMYGTPEMARFSTPQAYPARGPPVAHGDERREPPPGRHAAGSIPPRPSSQPRALTAIGSRPMEVARGPPHGEVVYGRREEVRPGQMEFGPEGQYRAVPFNDRQRLATEREMREHMDREAELRERDFREREMQRLQTAEEQRYMAERDRRDADQERDQRMRDRNARERTTSDPSRHGQHPGEFAPQGPPRQPPYGRPEPRDPRDRHEPRDPRDPRELREPRDPRDPAAWPRPGYEHPPGPPGPYEQQPHPPPPTSAGPYGPHPSYAHHPPERFPPGGPPPHAIPTSQPGPPPGHPYDSPERQRLGLPHTQHQLQQGPHRSRPGEEGPPPPSVAYNSGNGYIDPRSRPVDEGPPPTGQPRGLLSVQEMNRKGRVSPLPQAVQGAQPQLQGPADEPRIKSEFGRMFSGIGSGVRGIGAPSPVPGGAQLAHTNATPARRDENDPPEQAPEPPAKPPTRGKRRKAKDDEAKADEDSTGRSTPAGRAKRPKTHAHHHHHQYAADPYPRYEDDTNTGPYSHHHHHHHVPERTASPLQGSNGLLKNLKSSTPITSPTGKEFGLTHHHQPPRSAPSQPSKQAAVTSAPIPKPKKRVASQAVIESVADRPRKHLGDVIYKVQLKPAGPHPPNVKLGFASTPVPLPRDRIADNENSTLTVKVPRAHLTPLAREEITSRRALWGTDVYTDDSDVVAACIHSGWIRGEWGEDVDPDLLDLRKPTSKSRAAPASTEDPHQEMLTAPPPTGPVHVPAGRDLHVTVLILPGLEKYAGSTRFGISSREWGGVYNGHRAEHDGISFMIWNVRWVDGAAPQSRLRGKARRDRIHKAMSEILRSQIVNVKEKDTKKAERNGETGGEQVSAAGVDKENHPVHVNGKGAMNGTVITEKNTATVSGDASAGEAGVPTKGGTEDVEMSTRALIRESQHSSRRLSDSFGSP